MKWARWLLPVLTLALVLGFTWWDIGGARTGPGPLHSAHAAVAELAQGANCEGCHRAGAGVSADACTKCHAAVGAQRQQGVGLHGSLAADLASRCEACHSEHHGDASPLIAPHAWPRADVADVKEYDHRHVADFGLVGAHAALDCARCHEHALDAQPPAGGRFLGASQQCTSCHEDAHKGVFGADCARCHGQERPWAEAPSFPHDVFPLAQAHRQVACTGCHAETGRHSVASLQAQPLPARRCADCHDNPHGQPPLQATALRLADAQDCAKCHTATAWAGAKVTPEQHAGFGFALRGAHATAACATCHGDGEREPRWRGAAPQLAACAVCHEHDHGAAMMAAATAATPPANGCAGCHTDTDADWKAGQMPVAVHAATGFALVEPHAELACVKCHQGAAREQRFPGRKPDDCRACHDDVHRGQFDGQERYAQCTACHLPTRFSPAQFGVAAHAATAFPLTGAHDAVACAACHGAVQAGVRQFHGTSSDCATCHTDVHQGAFGSTAPGCARCHDTAAFAPVAKFDHASWTRYPLVGAHAKVDCAGCHPRAAARAGQPGRRLGPARGTSCSDCHSDPHAGQFRLGGATDCTNCHVPASFGELHFDHDKSRFPLDEVHKPVPCAKCHIGYRSGELTIVRYKPLGTACGDCHKLGVPKAGGK
ncbi:MAG: cytochrome c3 family protein [Planctomycetes bacterium]|nr:cytochrome c3 family protein [Planctomycetota bacterium]